MRDGYKKVPFQFVFVSVKGSCGDECVSLLKWPALMRRCVRRRPAPAAPAAPCRAAPAAVTCLPCSIFRQKPYFLYYVRLLPKCKVLFCTSLAPQPNWTVALAWPVCTCVCVFVCVCVRVTKRAADCSHTRLGQQGRSRKRRVVVRAGGESGRVGSNTTAATCVWVVK